MSRNNKQAHWIVVFTLLGCLAMAWFEGILRPAYPVKSALKILAFLGCAGLYILVCRDSTPFHAFQKPEKRSLKLAAALAAGVFVLILSGYAILAPWLDLSAIPGNLGKKEGITAATFPFAALYISFGNSLLEEFFFRGFAFLGLKMTGCETLAWGFSALAFALYHVAIMDGWFTLPLFLLLTAGLALAGLLFNWLDRKGSLWPSWLVHMGANLAINTIGLHLFGIL